MNNIHLENEKKRAQQRANDEGKIIYLCWEGYDYHTTEHETVARCSWAIITVCYPEIYKENWD